MPTSRYTWSRPTTHIYSYNREAQNILSSRSARASSVTASSSETSLARSSRAASVSASEQFQGYTGYYGRQLALINEKQGPTAAASRAYSASSLRGSSPAPTIYPHKPLEASKASVSSASASMAASKASMSASSASMSASKTSTVQEKTTSSVQKLSTSVEQSQSLEYGRKSASRAVRRAELHAAHSGKDPRHTILPRNVGDDIYKKVADLHISPYNSQELNGAKASYQQGRLKVERLEKELCRVTDAAMSYKSMWTKSASQMAKEAIEACEMEAASSKKIRRTVVEETSRGSRVAAA